MEIGKPQKVWEVRPATIPVALPIPEPQVQPSPAPQPLEPVPA